MAHKQVTSLAVYWVIWELLQQLHVIFLQSPSSWLGVALLELNLQQASTLWCVVMSGVDVETMEKGESSACAFP